mmetsp:Transcript_40146/g.40674  ORF Transcript_40146/g.40674 Transcript_40146/m.40674 type:complete len:134 (-) Transcript_40146:260-661(-)
MVTDLDIEDSNKEQLKKTLRKFEHAWSFRCWRVTRHAIKNCKPAHIKLKPGATSYKGRYHNLPKAYMYILVRKRFNVWSIYWSPEGTSMHGMTFYLYSSPLLPLQANDHQVLFFKQPPTPNNPCDVLVIFVFA